MNNTKLLLSLAVILCSFAANATQAKAEDESEICAKREADLARQPQLSTLVSAMGGAEAIEGRFKLGGLEGKIVKMRIAFASNPSEFTVQVNKDPLKQVFLCYVESDPSVLRIRVQQPLTPENGLFKVKPGKSVGNEMYVAAHASKWKFMKFKRIANEAEAEAAVGVSPAPGQQIN